MGGARFNAEQGIGDGDSRVVVEMHSDSDASERIADRFGRFVGGERGSAAVRVAQHKRVRARHIRRHKCRQRVLFVLRESVVEMLGVENHLFAVGFEERHALAYHRKVFFGRNSQYFRYLRKAGFAENADALGAGRGEGNQPAVGSRGDAFSVSCAESHEFGVGKLREKFGVLGIGGGVAALDVIHSERVEQFENLPFVRGGITYSRGLRAVSQSGVVKFYAHIIPLAVTCWWR